MAKSIPELVESFAEGDSEAFAELIGRFQPKICYLAFQILGNHRDADEGEVVCVNVAGTIDLAALETFLEDELDLPGLDEVDLR